MPASFGGAIYDPFLPWQPGMEIAGDEQTPSTHRSHSREPDRMEVFALVIWMLVGGDFQEIRWYERGRMNALVKEVERHPR